jgi:hypothetical protein
MATEPILHSAARMERYSVVRDAAGRAVRVSDLLSRAWAKRLLFLSGDVAALVASHHLAETLTQRSMKLPAAFLNPGYYYLFYAPFFTALLYLLGGYKSPDLRRPEKELELLFKSVSFSFIALACANFVLFKSLGFSRYLLAAWYVLALLFLLVARFGLRATYGALWRRGLARQKALLLGSPDGLATFQQRMAIQRYRGYEMAGVLVERGGFSRLALATLALPVLGSIDDWEVRAFSGRPTCASNVMNSRAASGSRRRLAGPAPRSGSQRLRSTSRSALSAASPPWRSSPSLHC